MTDLKSQGYCCNAAQLQFDWKLGVDDAIEPPNNIMAITRLQCLNCGAEYAFETQGRTACPVVHEASGDDQVVLRVKVKPMVPQ